MSKRLLTPEEKRLWLHFTQGVQRVESHPVELFPQPVKAASPSHKVMPMKVNPIFHPRAADLQAGDLTQIDRRTAQRLKRGQTAPEATLDLHGYVLAEAGHHFHQFLTEASTKGLRVVRVITGYGKMSGGNGVLKANLPRWVNLPENRRFILSYHQARPEDGGAGAWIILLKRKERL